MQKDLRILQIIQKAREFADTDLQNEDLLANLLKSADANFGVSGDFTKKADFAANADFTTLSAEEKEQIAACINELIKAKEKAQLS